MPYTGQRIRATIEVVIDLEKPEEPTLGAVATTESEGLRPPLDEKIAQIRTDVIRLGALACEAVGAATQALLDADLSAAERVIDNDLAVDELAHFIEEHCAELLALQAPVATDLRRSLATLRIVHEIERSADLMVNVAKATRRLYPNHLDPKVRGIVDQMGTQAVAQLRLAIDAYADEDGNRAAALADMDEAMDELTKALFRRILALGDANEANVQTSVQIALVGRHYERAADHAVTIAERVQYVVTGERPLPGSRHSYS